MRNRTPKWCIFSCTFKEQKTDVSELIGNQSKFQEPISLFKPKIQLFCSSILYRLHFYYISHFFSQSMKGDERSWDYLFLPKENSDVKYFKVTTTSFQNPYFQQRILGNATRTPLSIVDEHCCHILLYIVMLHRRGILLRQKMRTLMCSSQLSIQVIIASSPCIYMLQWTTAVKRVAPTHFVCVATKNGFSASISVGSTHGFIW